ncbi:hypothetical protein [Prosthecobacter sp.]|nr:hypothetical protein [Prosthecobacter sp.]MDI1313271.1 hypothetical protein [Prosthecobacter sp.]
MPIPGGVIQPAKVSAQVPEKKNEEKKLNGYEIELMKKKTPPSLRPMQKF